MTDNEKRAHDLACAVIANNELLQNYMGKIIKPSKLSATQIYYHIYKIFLKDMDRRCPREG